MLKGPEREPAPNPAMPLNNMPSALSLRLGSPMPFHIHINSFDSNKKYTSSYILFILRSFVQLGVLNTDRDPAVEDESTL